MRETSGSQPQRAFVRIPWEFMELGGTSLRDTSDAGVIGPDGKPAHWLVLKLRRCF